MSIILLYEWYIIALVTINHLNIILTANWCSAYY